MSIKSALFDFDDVIGLSLEPTKKQADAYAQYVKAEQIQKEGQLRVGYFTIHDAFEQLGMSEKEIKKALKARKELRAPNAHCINFVQYLQFFGITSHIATNAPPIALEQWFKAHPKLQKNFGNIYTPYDIGYRKPSEEYFIGVLKEIKVSPHQTIFFDDKLPNVFAASRVGIRSQHYIGGPFSFK